MFTCEGCVSFKPEGWTTFRAASGEPIPGRKCRQYDFYTHEAAMRVCDGRDKTLPHSTVENIMTPGAGGGGGG